MLQMIVPSRVDTVLYFGILFALLVRWGTSFFPYSGAQKPPIFGDYEAQRHWMEITLNLPEEDWYRNTSQNDLQYWGLDYPPLTAYHSLLCGYIARYFNNRWTALNSSRGYESESHKLFMRSTVVVADVLIYFTAIVLYWNVVAKPYKLRDKAIAITLMLLYPGLILVDHGHFQYNCVSLGLFMWAVLLIYLGTDLLAACAFVLALNYKQMELYHAIPFFAYLLGKCKERGIFAGAVKLVLLGLMVIGTTALCWFPFILDKETPRHVLERLFPVARGLFEDKVANFWCALSVIIKMKAVFTTNSLILISAGLTLISVLPSSIHLFLHPNFAAFKYALVNSSLAFFLFSYQVHEKSILLVSVPFLLHLDDQPVLTTVFSIISTFSMFPLFLKDGLAVPYFSLTIIYFVVAWQAYNTSWLELRAQGFKVLFPIVCSFLGCIILSVLPMVMTPPTRYPDIFPVLNALYSCVHFAGFLLCCNTMQIKYGTFIGTQLKKKRN